MYKSTFHFVSRILHLNPFSPTRGRCLTQQPQFFFKDLSDLDTERTKQRQWGYPTALCPTMYVCTSRVCFVSNVMICAKYASLCYSPNKLNRFPLATSDAKTIETILKSFIRIFTDGPAVSLNGSPTVSPTTAALWFSLPLPL